MPVDILYNGLRPGTGAEAVEQAAVTAVESRPGRWKLWLMQVDGETGFSIRVDGPDGAGFSYRFMKPHERTPEFVRTKIADGLREAARPGVLSRA